MLNAKERLEHGDGAVQPTEDILELIASLDRLHDLGILSEEEVKQKKAELLARL
jgi:hypothetical protein